MTTPWPDEAALPPDRPVATVHLPEETEMAVALKPPITYLGGKIRLAKRIAALLPERPHYVEPFCGSLSVLLARKPSAHETVNDLDSDLMNLWRVLRDEHDPFERLCALTPHSRAEQAAAYDLAGVSDLERARRVWVQLTQGRAGVRTRTGWRHYVDPAGSSTSMPRYLRGYLARFEPLVDRMRDVSLECRPALDVIESYGRSPNVLLYVDPPYLRSTRVSGGYAYDLPTETEHRDLAKALHASRAAVVLSGYPSDLYDRDLYADWHRTSIATATGQGGSWEPRTEVLWSNVPFTKEH